MGLMVVTATITISIASYVFARWVSGAPNDRHKDMAGAMVARIGALHGLIIALVFAQEMAAYQRIETQTAVEASAIADVYNDAARYDPVALGPLQRDMRAYLDVVRVKEWARLGAGEGLEPEAWAHWENAYDIVLDLVPANPRQESLRDHMLSSIHTIAASRDQRDGEAITMVAGFFWLAAITGVILIAIGYYIFPPERQNLVLLALFSGYTGAILFLIYGFSNPFSPPMSLSPLPFDRLAVALGAGP